MSDQNWISPYYEERLVSVIIPTFNREILLKEAIESVNDQTYRPIECIVVDDGSTDGTKELVSKIMENNSDSFSLKYIHQPNAGSQVARNNGTKLSTGEFIQYLDSDDLLYPEKLQKQVRFLNKNHPCDAVFGSWEMGNNENRKLIEAWDSEDMITQLLVEKGITILSFLYRREIVNIIGEWDINLRRNQEIDFQVRGVLAGGNFRHQNEICGLWRIHEGERIANTTGSKDFLNFYSKWETILNRRDLFTTKIKNRIANTHFWLATNNMENRVECLKLLEESVRLNPKIDFAQTWKMRLFKNLFGLKLSLRIWMKRYLMSIR